MLMLFMILKNIPSLNLFLLLYLYFTYIYLLINQIEKNKIFLPI